MQSPDQLANLCNAGPEGDRKGWNPGAVVKVMNLLMSQQASDMPDRITRAVDEMLAEFPQGLVISALAPLFAVTEQLLLRSRENEGYLSLICRVVELLGLPLWKERETISADHWEFVVQVGSVLGCLLKECHQPRVRLAVCRALGVIIPGRAERRCAHQFRFKALSCDEYLLALEESSIGESLMEAMRGVEEEGLYMEMLKVLLALCYRSERNCRNMVDAELPHVITQRMLWTDDVLFVTAEVLIQMMVTFSSADQPESILKQLACRPCVSTLRAALHHQLRSVQSVVNRQLRNDILTLSVSVARLCPPVPLVETGLAADLLHLAVHTELKSERSPFSYLQLLTSSEDFEMKKLLLVLPALLLRTTVTISMLSEHQVMLSLLMLISRDLRPSFAYNSAVSWTEPQFRELQLLALRTLAAIIASLPEDALQYRAGTRLLLYLTSYLDGSPLVTVDHLQACMQALHNAAASGEPALLADLADQDAVSLMTTFLRHPRVLALAAGPQRMAYVALATECLAILSFLCDEDPHRKSLFGSRGVDALLSTLLETTRQRCRLGPRHYTVIVNAMDAVWSCVTGCASNENEFLMRGGCDTLLDLTDAGGLGLLKLQTLGCLLRLCDTCPAAAKFILRWRGSGGRTCVQLLMALWRQEEDALGCHTDADGIITDLEQPLRGALQPLEPFSAAPEPVAVAEMVGKMRPKIFGIIEHLKQVRGDDGLFVRELTDIDVRDQVTMALVESYLDLKEGEVCAELRAQVASQGVKPVLADRLMLDDLRVIGREKSQYAQSLQTDLRSAALRRHVADERQFFERLKRLEMQELLAIRRVSEYIARTSCHRVLAQAKRRQEQEVQDTTCQPGPGKYYRTLQRSTNVTVFSARHLDIQLTPRDNKFDDDEPLTPDTDSDSTQNLSRF
ncbi:Cilia- and flagella-associated protein 69 [Amphibalanus amphitrite]|uniref:Cilia-and flagella-associated protein 69 n=1 Tax=Amphibalanus amphitrite TaxID=1232801 RepID=A0A6A4WHJ6_AMPAM|nr:cilia- and flagella-associated protein 69-like [Amphibalanus amphitrite]KAF0303314.1 Cilia- and flagella-associated protein 69 [Amphibalanus amphitrite]